MSITVYNTQQLEEEISRMCDGEKWEHDFDEGCGDAIDFPCTVAQSDKCADMFVNLEVGYLALTITPLYEGFE